jgi:hypothetical protein
VPELTRRREPDAQQETWLIHYGDVRVGVIAERVGNPDSTPGWQWACGFYPGSNLAERTGGLAETFDQARGAFEAACRFFLVKHGEADFDTYRCNRAFHARREVIWARGLKLPTQVADGRAVCLCRRCDRHRRHERPRLRRAHGSWGYPILGPNFRASVGDSAT